jgi:hypothetical protein
MVMTVCAQKGGEEHGKRDVVNIVPWMDREMSIANWDSNGPTQGKRDSSAPLQ